MQRLINTLTVVILALLILPAYGQSSSDASSPTRTLARPPEAIPVSSLQKLLQRSQPDSLSEAAMLRHLAHLYTHQSEILVALAEDDPTQTEALLDSAMAELRQMIRYPGLGEQPRFRELYRSIVTEYEAYYGASDTLLTLPNGDIFELRDEMFAALNDVDEPLLEDVMMPELPPMDTEFPMTMNRLVERSVDFLLRERKEQLGEWSSRADTYFPMVEQIFREEGVPEELKYLAVIESGLNPRARSWARAVGMWQFVAGTGRAYGLDVTPWVDERMDPEKATRAAARHLKDLYEMYGHDWQVALAGYNCSPRCIKRAIRRAGGGVENPPSFWEIYPYVPSQTRNYVPIFIAASLVLSNPNAFGLDDLPTGPRYAYDHVPVKGMISLDDIASMADTDVATIRALNPELRRSTLPPTTDAYMLRLPMGSYDQFAEAYEALPDEAKRPVGDYIVRRGDTLGKIAHQYGISVRKLMEANGLGSTLIRVGQRLVVPVPRYDDASTLADAQPVTVEYGSRTVRPIEPLGPDEPETEETPVVRTSTTEASAEAPTGDGEAAEEEDDAETRIVYHVRRGDTLIEIADRYDVYVSDLRRWNNISGSRIRVGQTLSIYSSKTDASERVTHTVRRGDTLGEIAGRYGVSVRELRGWNNLRSSTIHVGQQLTIYRGDSKPAYIIYRVRRGDSLYIIARKYGVSVRNLKQWNDLRSNTIQPGQRLKIYG